MTFQEALDLKGKIGNTFEFKEFNYLTIVVPLDRKEKMKYLEYIYTNSEIIKDEHAKLFSSNGKFDINGLVDDFNVFIHTSEHPYREQ